MEKFKLPDTPYRHKMDKSLPWADYPRPSMRRSSYFCLNGEWDFAYSESEPKEYKEKILVPFPPESELSGIEREHTDGEKLYYRRSFTLPDGFVKKRVVLHFGAVDQICEVYLNGKKIGEHAGGYFPFSFDVTDALTANENVITVIATDTLSPLYPYGKQTKKRGGMWYTPVSGIWQAVWMESLVDNAIENIRITPTDKSVKIEVFGGESKKTLTLSDGTEYVFEGESIVITPESPRAWSPEDPYLYYFTLKVGEDIVESYFALRLVDIRSVNGIPRICLNGKPYLFHGLLEQGYYPDGIFLPATAEGYEADILAAKALGFNTLRKHIKIEPDIFYYLCDKHGMIVFQDMINNSDYSFFRDTALPTVGFKRLSDRRLHRDPKSREIFLSGMERTAKLLYNHPSIVYYTIFNEGWGQFRADDAYDALKAIDPTRIIDSTSGWFWQNKSDVDSHHVYFKKLKTKPSKSRPTVISEFGGYSHRCDGHLFGEKNYGYKTYESREEFEDAVESLYLNEVAPLVKAGDSAFIYTQISDVEDETNGLLTYDRCLVKVSEERMQKISNVLEENIK